MENMCLRCSRLAIRPARGVTCRTFVTSTPRLDKSSDTGVAKAGSPIEEAIKSKKPVIRKVDFQAPQENTSASSNNASPARPRPLIRRTDPRNTSSRPASSPVAKSGPVLRRVAKPGQVLIRRTSAGDEKPSTGSRPEGSVLRRTAGGRLQLRGKPPQAAKQVDKRRRRAPREEDEGEIDQVALETQMDNYISTYIDRPENPTEPVLYEPKEAKVDDLRSDWPNTPLSTLGMTESVVQKIEWLARRLPHGYQSPEQIAEHYLKGNLTRFESEEEKQLVLKIASEMSAQTKDGMDEGTIRKFDSPRFAYVEDPKFTSLQGKQSDRNFLLNSSIKGDYVEKSQHKFPFMQNAARMLGNNQSYGPVQSQKLLARVHALIPQGRPAAQAKKA